MNSSDWFSSNNDKWFFGHPKGLLVLSLTEIWERFSYYGMRALMTLYLIDYYGALGEAKAESIAYGVFGSYGSLVYATPILGGIVADRLIGARKSVTVGGILMALGHFLMAIETEFTLYIALGLIIIGNGYFKPNIGSLVGKLYPENDSRRDSGFTLFYMGVNIGAALAPLACGTIAVAWGWHYGFNLAGIGMLLGLIIYRFGVAKGIVQEAQIPTAPKTVKFWGSWGLGLLLAPFLGWVIYSNEFVFTEYNTLTYALFVVLAVILTIMIIQFFKIDKVATMKLVAVVFLTLFITVFWSFFEQAGSSLTVFAKKNVHLKYLTPSGTNAINPLWIMVLAIPFSMLWQGLSKRRLNPRTPYKSALAIFQLGLGFLIFALSARYADADGMVSMSFLVFGYLLVTTGELFISPIGLSKTTELSPAKLVGFMLGVYYFSSSFAHLIAGGIAKMTTAPAGQRNWLTDLSEKITGLSTNGDLTGNMQGLAQYTNVFASIAIVSFIVALLVFLSAPVLKRWMHGVH